MKDYIILASTGTFVGRNNDYNYHKMVELKDKIKCDGFEFMMMSVWNGEEDKIVDLMKSNDVKFPTYHTDKSIGVYLESNKKKDALDLLGSNICMAQKLGCEKVVVHLWAGQLDKSNRRDILSCASEMNDMCKEKGLLLTIENIPSVRFSSLELWEELLNMDEDIKFTFDTRFSTFFNLNEKTFESRVWKNVRHIHISSYDKNIEPKVKLIRPILHPGEGLPDFDDLFSKMPKYRGTITLESPVLGEDGRIDVEKLNTSLEYIATLATKYTTE